MFGSPKTAEKRFLGFQPVEERNIPAADFNWAVAYIVETQKQILWALFCLRR